MRRTLDARRGNEPTFDVSVVIPARNAEQTIEAQLQALAGQESSFPFELVVVDNGSDDRTAALIESRRSSMPGVRLVDGQGCSGAAAVRNLGARSAGGETILFCDADDVVAPTWVHALSSAMASRSLDLAAGVCRTDGLNHPETLEWRTFPVEHRWNGIFYGLACNMAITRAAFEDLGGFAEGFPNAGGEDADLFIRAHLAGMRVDIVPDAEIQYRFRDTVPDLLRQFHAYGRAEARLDALHCDAVGVERSGSRFRDVARWAAGAPIAAARGDRAAAVRKLRRAASAIGRIRGDRELRGLG